MWLEHLIIGASCIFHRNSCFLLIEATPSNEQRYFETLEPLEPPLNESIQKVESIGPS